MKRSKWKKLSARTIIDHPLFSLDSRKIELPGGKVINDYVYLKVQKGVIIVPVTKDNEMILLNHYKYAVDKEVLLLPGGLADTIKESSLAAAKRELLEETGYSGRKFIYLGKLYVDPTNIDQETKAYLALGCEKIGGLNLDETEDITVKKFPISKVRTMVKEGKIRDSASLACLMMAAQCGIFNNK